MAYIYDVYEESGTATSITLSALPEHATDDFLYLCVSDDNGGTAASISAGWSAALGTPAASGAMVQTWFRIKCTSSSMTPPTVTGRANEGKAITVFTIRDADTTTPEDITPIRTDWNAVSSFTSPAAGGSTTTAGCLLLYSVGADSTGVNAIYMDPAVSKSLIESYNVGLDPGHFISSKYLPTATTIPQLTYYHNSTEGGNAWVIPIRNKSGGKPPIHVTGLFDVVDPILPGVVTMTTAAPNTFTPLAAAGTLLGIAGSATNSTPTLAGPTTANGIHTGASFSSTEAATLWVGSVETKALDLSGSPVMSVQVAMNGNASTARWGSEGTIIGFEDSSGYWEVFYVAKPGQITLNQWYTRYFVPGSTTPAASGGGGAINWADVQKVAFLHHRLAAASTTAVAHHFRLLTKMNGSVVCGGNPTTPITPATLSKVFLQDESYYGFAGVQGRLQGLNNQGLQIGDGTNETYVDFTAASYEQPEDPNVPSYVVANDFVAGTAPLTIKASADDTIYLKSCIIASSILQPFTVDAASSLSADFQTTGLSMVGRTFSDLAGYDWTSVSWTDCATVAFKNGDVTNCTIASPNASINGTTGAVCSFSADGATVSGTTINCNKASGVTGYHIELGTAVTAITLTDVTFTGTPGTDKVHVLKTTGTVTITISGTTSLAAGDVTTEGATVVISAPVLYQSVVVSGFTAGSRIQIYDTTNSVELFNGTASAGDTVVSGTTATWTDPTAAAGSRAIRVRVAYVSGVTAKQFIETSGLTCGVTSGTESVTYPITQVADTTYDANGINGPTIYAGSGVTFTDAATDLVNINVGVAGTVSLQTVYACFVYWIFTAAGIDDDVAYIDAPDPANYILTSMKFRNTSATPLKITGGYFYDSTGSVENCVDDAGSTGNIYPMPAHVVAYATGSGALTAGDITNIWSAATRTITTTIPTASDVATQVLTSAQLTPIYADARKMNGATITGTGVDSDLWRGA